MRRGNKCNVESQGGIDPRSASARGQTEDFPMLQQHDLVQDPSASAVPFAEELSDENLEALFGGKPVVCGCGWLCSFT